MQGIADSRSLFIRYLTYHNATLTVATEIILRKRTKKIRRLRRNVSEVSESLEIAFIKVDLRAS